LLTFSLFILSILSVALGVFFLRSNNETVKGTEDGSQAFLIAGILAVPFTAMLMYYALGDPNIPALLNKQESVRSSTGTNFDPERHLEQINELLDKRPDDPALLSQISSVYMMLGKFDLAVQNAKHLVSLSPANASALVQLADALAMKSDGEITDEIVDILKTALKADDENPVAMTLLGIGYEQRGRSAEALDFWRKAAQVLPAESPLKQRVEEMIGQVTPDIKTDEKKPIGPVSIEIDISDPLKIPTSTNAQLFVMLKNQGMKPPIAVSKIVITEFPIQAILDDSSSMLPGISLGDFDSIYGIARISLSGSPLPKKGDLEGRSPTFNPKETSVISIVIDKIVD